MGLMIQNTRTKDNLTHPRNSFTRYPKGILENDSETFVNLIKCYIYVQPLGIAFYH